MASRAGIALLAAVLVAAIAGVLVYTTPPPDPVAEGAPAPTFTLRALVDDDPVSLASLRGRVVLVNFWATWCPPCEAEMPSMERLHRALADLPFTLLAVSVDEDPETVRAFRARFGLTFPILYAPGGGAAKAVAESYGTRQYPESFLIGPDGRIVGRFIGPREWDAEGYVERIRRVASQAPSAP